MRKALYNGYKLYLIESVEEFKYIRGTLNEKVAVGFDTETTGLSYLSDRIVGICIACGKSYSQKDYRGFYLPIRHNGYENNLPIEEVVKLSQEIIDKYVTWWWNRNYDATMLEFEGIEFPCIGKTNDAQCLAHLVKNDRMPALKNFVQDYLHFQVQHYEDNGAEGNSFANTDPTVSFVYAAADPLITTLIARKLWTDYPYTHKIYPLDNKFADVMRRIMYKADLYFDRDIIKVLYDQNAKELASVRNKIFTTAGYTFKLNSNRDKAEALSRFVTLTVKTAKGDFKVDKEVLAEIDHPMAKLLLQYARLEKYRSSYLEKMMVLNNPFKINYQHCNAETGRLSSGGSKGNPFFAPLNVQNFPKVEMFKYLHRDNSPIGYRCDLNPLQAVAGVVDTPSGNIQVKDLKEGDEVLTSKGVAKVVSVTPTDQMCARYGEVVCEPQSYVDGKLTEYKEPTEQGYLLDLGEDIYSVKSGGHDVQIRSLMKMKCKGGIRDAFICPPGYVWISQDYSAEEVVLLANLSGEPNLLNPIKEGKDIHKYVAIQMFGHYEPTHRTISKTITFCSNYGGSGATIARRLGVSKEQGDMYLERYNKTMSKAYAWKQQMIKEGRRKGFVFTFFGRPRAVYQFYNSSKPGMKGYADRTCMNSPIQGGGGDIIRIDHIRYWECIDPKSPKYDKEFAENTMYINTVHDEINLYVKECYIRQASDKLYQLMYQKYSQWQVPIKTSPSVGTSWGNQIEFSGWTEDNKIIPDCEEDLSLL